MNEQRPKKNSQKENEAKKSVQECFLIAHESPHEYLHDIETKI